MAFVLVLGAQPLCAQDGATTADQPTLRLPVETSSSQPLEAAPIASQPVVTLPDGDSRSTSLDTITTSDTTGSTLGVEEPPAAAGSPESSPATTAAATQPAPRSRSTPPVAAARSRRAGAGSQARAILPATADADTVEATGEPAQPLAEEVRDLSAPPRSVSDVPALPADDSVVVSGDAAPAETVGLIGLLVSGLAVLGLLVLAFVVFRRRRKVEIPVIERPRVTPEARPEATDATTDKGFVTSTKFAQTPPVRDIREWAQPVPSAKSDTST